MILRSKPRFVDGCQLSIAAFDYHRVSTYVRPMILIPANPKLYTIPKPAGPPQTHWTPEQWVPGRQAVAYRKLQRAVNPTDDARGHAYLNRALATQLIHRYALAPASANASSRKLGKTTRHYGTMAKYFA